MNIEIICVGKLKEKYLKQGIAEYLKRLGAYATVKVIEVADEATGDNMSETEIDQVLAIEGKIISSEELAAQLDQFATYGDSKVSFIIGGSLGLADELKKRSDLSISFGRITLPHQLMRLVLVEQIYRAFRIKSGHAYHK